MVAETIVPRKHSKARVGLHHGGYPKRLAEIEGDVEERIPLPIGEFSRVLGGGVVPGSLVLIGGDPGIGKSTLILQAAMQMASEEPVLYISGEESQHQIKARALRLADGKDLPDELFLLTETDLDQIIAHIQELGPRLAVIDSIQAVHITEIESGAGSIVQVRESASRLQALAKSSAISIFLIGHVTKEGAIAGPRVLEHIVDTVLYLEGDAFHTYRLLRSAKNRFGATTEIGVFEMKPSGMVEVTNPSEAFLAERVVNSPGSAIAVIIEGTRPLLVEVQGLTSNTSFGHPRRTANGIDFNRLLLIIAVLSRRVGLRLADQDVFVNIVGGLRVSEPAADLAAAVAIASSLKNQPLPADMAFIGEVGLSGELRTVSRISTRLREAVKLGFSRVIVPKSGRLDGGNVDNLKVLRAGTINEAIRRAV
jgi:DNA repair protein RadA/Sms